MSSLGLGLFLKKANNLQKGAVWGWDNLCTREAMTIVQIPGRETKQEHHNAVNKHNLTSKFKGFKG